MLHWKTNSEERPTSLKDALKGKNIKEEHFVIQR